MKATILIVEDEDLVRAMLQLAFERRGFTVFAAARVADALTLVSTHLPDVALTDFQLPDGNGLELCRVLRKQSEALGQKLPILVMTGSHELTEKEVADAGAKELLRKPFKVPEVCERITRFLRDSAKKF